PLKSFGYLRSNPPSSLSKRAYKILIQILLEKNQCGRRDVLGRRSSPNHAEISCPYHTEEPASCIRLGRSQSRWHAAARSAHKRSRSNHETLNLALLIAVCRSVGSTGLSARVAGEPALKSRKHRVEPHRATAGCDRAHEPGSWRPSERVPAERLHGGRQPGWKCWPGLSCQAGTRTFAQPARGRPQTCRRNHRCRAGSDTRNSP